MIERTSGNILTADVEALVNTVNCVGVMGKGIALQFKKAFPENFEAYAAACRREEVRPGRMFVFETGQMFNPRFIYQLSHQAPLARQKPLRGYRIRLESTGSGGAGAQNSFHCRSSIGFRPGRTSMEQGQTDDRSGV